MTHFLDKRVPRPSYSPIRVVVTVELVGKVLRIVDKPLGFSKEGSLFMPLPKDVVVTSLEGDPIFPCWGFWISLETIDPFHLLMDWDGES